MNTTMILAAIGAIALILTAATRIPAALAEFLRACISVATALHELRTALHPPDTHPGEPADQQPRRTDHT